MKTAKWLIALVALMMVVGCEKSDEAKAEDALEDAKKSISGAFDGIGK